MSTGGEVGASSDRVVVLGRIGGTFGVHGWVKVTSFTEPVDNILDYPEWLIGREGRWRTIKVEDGRLTGKGVLAKLEGVDSPEAARLESGQDVGVMRSAMPPAAPGEYYWSDLEGLEVSNPAGEHLGRIDHFRSTPAGVLVVVRGEREHWIPFVKERIVSVDLGAAQVVLDWGADW